MAETIYSLSSGGLPAGVAVVRLSGAASRFVLETIAGVLPPARQAFYRTLRDTDVGVIDRGLVLFFPGPASFTGEDCGEFHIHGSRAAVARLLEVLGGLEGVRQAEPGEFTRRAFENGKLDLTEVEGLADLLRAETEMQRRAAVEQSGGGLRHSAEGWMRRLTHARAMLEAELDFADEEDVPGAVSDRVWADLAALAEEIDNQLSGGSWGEIVREGFRIALLGPPNAGKSTLLNRLADRDVAIVSDQPGTTRDALEVRLEIAGHLVLVSDTAGLRESDEAIEIEGMKRSRRAAELADLVLLLSDGSAPFEVLPEVAAPALRVLTKSDLGIVNDNCDLFISAKTGVGVDELLHRIAREIDVRARPLQALPNRQRHRELLRSAFQYIEAGVAAKAAGPEIVAVELAQASEALGRLTGRVDVEDLLGVIFSEFCIGK